MLYKTVENDISHILLDENVPWNDIMNRSVLVTGATGMIGKLIVYCLIRLKCSIYVIVRNLEKAKKEFGEDVYYVVQDIRDEVCIPQNCDYIIHCASVTKSSWMISNPVETLDINYRGTYNILEYAKKNEVKSIVYLSSMEAYGEVSVLTPLEEKQLGYINLDNVRSSYPESKRVCELLCRSYFKEYGVPTKNVRLAQTFGPGANKEDNRMFMQFANSVLNKKNITLKTFGKSFSNFVYTADAVRGIFLVLLKGLSCETYNICNDAETRTIKEIAEMMCERIGNNEIIVEFDIQESERSKYASDTMLHLSSKKIEKLGWKPETTMIEAYRNLIAYLME